MIINSKYSNNNNMVKYLGTSKIVVIGKEKVGKTSFVLSRYCNKTFLDNSNSDANGRYVSIPFKHENYIINFEIWDISGKKKYRKYYYNNTEIAIIMYDVSKIKTFKYALELFYEIKKISSEIIIYILGNKIDLDIDLSELEYKFISNLPTNVTHYFISVKNYININEIFLNILSRLFKNKIYIHYTMVKKEKNTCCIC